MACGAPVITSDTTSLPETVVGTLRSAVEGYNSAVLNWYGYERPKQRRSFEQQQPLWQLADGGNRAMD